MIFRTLHTDVPVWPGVLTVCLWMVCCSVLYSQTSFTSESRVLVFMENTFDLREITINPGNNALKFQSLGSNTGKLVDAIGFRSTDGFLYGLDPQFHQLYRLDANGDVEILKQLSLTSGHQYLAGDISPDGKYLLVIGSVNGSDKEIVRIDLTNTAYPVEISSWASITHLNDLAFSNDGTLLFAYDTKGRRVVRIDLDDLSITLFGSIREEYQIQGLYFNTFGELLALGTAQFGVASGLFIIDQNTGKETIYTTGPENYTRDIAAANCGVEMRNKVFPEVTFPCSDLTFTITIANGSGKTLEDLDLNYSLPDGFTMKQVVSNPFGGFENMSSSQFRIEGMKLEPGIAELIIRAEVGNVAGDLYKSQVSLHGLDLQYGNTIFSDDPASKPREDSTRVKVNRIEEDSLVFSKFLCLGESLELDGSEYGNNLQWSTGSREPILEVTDAGVYTLQAISACQTTTIVYKVVVATCPYTIELRHTIIPEETLPCSDVVFQFVTENETGIIQENISFVDTLPEGFTFGEFLDDPLGGTLESGLAPGIIHIQNMQLPIGLDTFSIKVEVGDILPEMHQNQAKLVGFPLEIGPLRFSDNPYTQPLDATPVTVLGVDSDTLFVEEILCPGYPLMLDARPFGVDHLWYDGSELDQHEVNTIGTYHLRVFDGCEVTQVFFEVIAGSAIEIELAESPVEIRLGDSLYIRPLIINDGDELNLTWYKESTLLVSGDQDLELYDLPLSSTVYNIRAENEQCIDSVSLEVKVDKSPRIYAPNVFSPNNDGVNDQFYIQSPDFGLVKNMRIFDRWGRLIFESRDTVIDKPSNGWDGTIRDQPVESGMYFWIAEVEFLDGRRQSFSGEILITR